MSKNISPINIGDIYGNMTLQQKYKKEDNLIYWNCKCICGKEKDFSQKYLRKINKKGGKIVLSCGCLRGESRRSKLLRKNSGLLNVIGEVNKNGKRECICKCGNKVMVSTWRLNNQKAYSCGCFKPKNRKKYPFKDLTGLKFGRLTVVKESYKKKYTRYWECICDCGGKTVTQSGNLKNGTTNSCGCYKKDRSHESLTHGMNKTRFYRIWQGIKRRCYDPKQLGYKNYGGRGIVYDLRWEKFEEFQKDMYSSYLEHSKIKGEDNTTIDRINVNGNYTKENCRWITRRENSNNRRNTKFIEYNGENLSVSEWAEKTGLSFNCIWLRIINGWSIKDTLTIPNIRGKSKKNFNKKIY